MDCEIQATHFIANCVDGYRRFHCDLTRGGYIRDLVECIECSESEVREIMQSESHDIIKISRLLDLWAAHNIVLP